MAIFETTAKVIVHPDKSYTLILPPVAEDSEGQEGLIYNDGTRKGGLRGFAPGALTELMAKINAGITENITTRVEIEASDAHMIDWHNNGWEGKPLKAKLLKDESARAKQSDLTDYEDDPVDRKFNVYIFMEIAKATSEAIAALKQIYYDAGEIEVSLLARKYSHTGDLPAIVYGSWVLGSLEMKDAFVGWFQAYGAKGVITPSIKWKNWEKDEVILTNFPGLAKGDILTAKEIEALFCAQFNMKLIK